MSIVDADRLPPDRLELTNVELRLASGERIRGTGELNLAAPGGPLLTLAGTTSWGLFEPFTAPPAQGSPGELMATPDSGFEAKIDGIDVRGIHVLPEVQNRTGGADGVTVEGGYRVRTVVLERPACTTADSRVRTDVFLTGRQLGLLVPDLRPPRGGVRRGVLVESGPHTFVLGTRAPAAFRGGASSSAGMVAYLGPLALGEDALGQLLWRFGIALGSALGSPQELLLAFNTGERGACVTRHAILTP